VILFYRAQAAQEVRRVAGAGRKENNIANLFSGITRCGYSGPMVFLDKGSKEKRFIPVL
jgi:hypothetical protein